ncbi:MAG: peptide-methionine (S)-S-oxide reductase [Firmicutes bacterium]|nr:peptide-methionine (S)-S-oxide reductase [Bacillota bacterium]
MEARFGSLKGVLETEVGYSGGSIKNPSYRQMYDHTEVVKIIYNSEIISLHQIIDIFFDSFDYTSRPFSNQYKPIILYNSDDEWEVIEEIMFQKGIRNHHVEIKAMGEYYRAEDYHQKFYLKNAELVRIELRKRYESDLELEKSIDAVKINSLLGGFKPKGFDFDKLNISDEGIEFLKLHSGDYIGVYE